MKGDDHSDISKWCYRLGGLGMAFWFAQSITGKIARRIWNGECPMLMLNKSLFTRDNKYYDFKLRSPFCEWLARRGINIWVEAYVFVVVLLLGLMINVLVLVPAVYILFIAY